MKTYLLGISGGSASGKTTLLRHLMDRYSEEEITLISQDNYYRDRSVLPRDSDGQINFDHPDAVDMAALAADLKRLQAGETIYIEEYTYNNPDLKPEMLEYKPAPIIIVEGLFVFHYGEVAKMLDLKVFVDAAEHVKLSRRIKRDFKERGYQLDEVLEYYERFVIPMYKTYIEPFKDECDLVIPNNSHMSRATRVLINHLNTLLP